MSPDNNRSDDYWMGVRDALRMVDSFLRWSVKNEDRAKSMEDFIHDGLVAAAKRCESCLHKELGVDFDTKYSPSVEPEEEVSDELEEISPYPDVSFESTPPEILLEPKGSSEEESVSISIELEETAPHIAEFHPEEIEIPTGEVTFEETEVPVDDDAPTDDELIVDDDVPVDTPVYDDKSVHIESMGFGEGSLEDDTTVDGETREFSSDFRLIEPDSLVIDEGHEEEEEEEGEDETTAELVEEYTSSWEETYRPPDETPPETYSSSTAGAEEKKPWSPMDEPSFEPDNELDFEDESESSESPPPPPPPPETEESEEERRRRARRLFFGG